MEFHLFIANDIQASETIVSANHIADILLQAGFWAFSPMAPLARRLKEADKVLIYLAGKGRRHFVARADIAAEARTIVPGSEREELLRTLGLGFMKTEVELAQVEWFNNPIVLQSLIEDLQFIKEKKNYGLHLRLPIVRIRQSDYIRITRERV